MIDGNTAPTSRIARLLYSGSAMLRQESPYTEFWYHSLKPYVHYIPLSFDGGDLLEKVQWAREHDAEAQQLALNAKQLAEAAFTDESIGCYWHQLLQRYAQLQAFKPQLSEEFKQVAYSRASIKYMAQQMGHMPIHVQTRRMPSRRRRGSSLPQVRVPVAA